MSRRTPRQKITRTVTFMMGIGHPEVAAALRPYGFSDQELERAHQLLRQAIGATLPPLPPTFDHPAMIRALDDWENRWLHVADVVLAIHFPNIRARVFLNLARRSDSMVIVTVDAFLRRPSCIYLPSSESTLSSNDAGPTAAGACAPARMASRAQRARAARSRSPDLTTSMRS